MMNTLMWGYTHIHGTWALFQWYQHHHAVRFLLSGRTSESPANWRQAFRLLWWLVTNRISPVDW